MNFKKIASLFLVALSLCFSSMTEAKEIASYQLGDWKKILQSSKGKPLIVHFWGFTCGPCLDELPRWGEFIKEFPSAKVTFVEVDQVPQQMTIQALAKAGLARADNRASVVFFDEYMRHEVDPKWFGELPITMLIDAKGQIRRIRGVVDFSQLRAWLKAQ